MIRRILKTWLKAIPKILMRTQLGLIGVLIEALWRKYKNKNDKIEIGEIN